MSLIIGLFPNVNVKSNPHNYQNQYRIRDNILVLIMFSKR